MLDTNRLLSAFFAASSVSLLILSTFDGETTISNSGSTALVGHASRWNSSSSLKHTCRPFTSCKDIHLYTSSSRQFIFCSLEGVSENRFIGLLERAEGRRPWDVADEATLVLSNVTSCDVRTYARTSFVRNPFTRIISAFLDPCVLSQSRDRVCTNSNATFESVLPDLIENSENGLGLQKYLCGLHALSCPFDYIGKFERELADGQIWLQRLGLWSNAKDHNWNETLNPDTMSTQSRLNIGGDPSDPHFVSLNLNHARIKSLESNVCNFFTVPMMALAAQQYASDFSSFGYDPDEWRKCAERSSKGIKVFVYDPDWLHTLNANLTTCYEQTFGSPLWKDEDRVDRAQDSAEVWLHDYFSTAHDLRVSDPDDADVIYFPLYLKTSWSLEKVECGDGLGVHEQRVEFVRHKLSEEILFQARSHRFFSVCQFWQCRRALMSLQTDAARMIVGIHERHEDWTGRSNMTDGKLVLIPYVPKWDLTALERKPMEAVPPILSRSEWSVAQWISKSLIFQLIVTIFNWPRIHILLCWTCSERRVRGVLAKLDWPSLNGTFRLKELSTGVHANTDSEYAIDMLGSRFCLHVRGDTSTSRRLFDAVAAGCIPIIIANDIDNHLPFPLDVPYPAFVKRVDERLEVKGMEEALRRIWNETTESELVEMQKMLLEVREKLVYGFGDPFGNKSLGRWES